MSFSLRLSHKILLIGFVGLLGLVVFGGIYLAGSASLDASRQLAENARKVAALNEKLGRDLLNARRAEKDFMLRRDEASSKRHASLTENIKTDVDQLRASVGTGDFAGMAGSVNALGTGFNEYQKQFNVLEQNEIKLGLDEKLGLSGSLRASVHDIETKLKEVDNSKLAAGMLMMRRHEKDFMLRRDPKYIEEFQKSVADFAKAVAASDLSAAMKSGIEEKLARYRNDFAAWAEAAKQTTVAAAAMSNAYSNIEPVIEEIEKSIKKRYDDAQAQEADTLSSVKSWMLTALGFMILIVSCLSLTISRSVTNAIARISRSRLEFTRGRFDPRGSRTGDRRWNRSVC